MKIIFAFLVLASIIGACSANARFYHPELNRSAYDSLHDELALESMYGVSVNELPLLPDMHNVTHISEWKRYMDSVELMLAYEAFYHIQYGSLHTCALQSKKVRAAITNDYQCTMEPLLGSVEDMEEFLPPDHGYSVYSITDEDLRAQAHDNVLITTYLAAMDSRDDQPMRDAWDTLQNTMVAQRSAPHASQLQHSFLCWGDNPTATDMIVTMFNLTGLERRQSMGIV